MFNVERSRHSNSYFLPPNIYLQHSSNIKSGEHVILQFPGRYLCAEIWVLFVLHSIIEVYSS